jgi:hypothetical protein
MLQQHPFKLHAKLSSRGRKGIPDSFRAHAWCVLTDAVVSVSPKKGAITYEELGLKQDKSEVKKLIKILMAEEGDIQDLKDIHRDVPRTLPNHIYFQSSFMHGQQDLFTILKCISISDRQIGYVQGLGYMVAILLTYLDREDTMNLMLKIFHGPKYRMRDFYLPGFPALKKTFYVHLSLLKIHMRKVFDRNMENMFNPMLYATQWFITLFSSGIPL